MFNKITLKKLSTLDFVSQYEIKNIGFFNMAYLNLFDVNNRFCGTTKEYDVEKLQKFVKKEGMIEV